MFAAFTEAAKEEMLPAFAPWSADECISAFESEGKKPHQGVAGKNPALHPGITWSNSTAALGLRGVGRETRVGSRCTSEERQDAAAVIAAAINSVRSERVNKDGNQEMVKVGFKLDRDQDDYPPADWEWMWASRVSDSTFKLDNAPFFAKGVSSGDIVAAESTQSGLVFAGLVEPSGHSTVRVVVFRENRNDEQVQALVSELRESLKALGCSTELSQIPNLFSVDIPPEVDYSSVSAFLSRKEAEGVLEYEEACLA